MDWGNLEVWLNTASLPLLAAFLFGAMLVAAAIGFFLQRHRHPPTASEPDGGEGYIVSAVLGLLALLLGFTFSMAVDRFDMRRALVLEEANAIGTAYLRSQVLPEPHRARMSDLFVRYTDNRITLAKAAPGTAAQQQLLAVNDGLVTDIWAGSTAAFDSIRTLDFSSAYLESVNSVIDLDASRKMARAARVPTEVFIVLFIYVIVTAAIMGYVLTGARGRLAGGILLALLTLSMTLILDINRPVLGAVTESQRPMEELRNSLAAQPPAVFDKWRTPGAEPLPPTPSR